MVKSTQFEQNWVLFIRKWYTDGWVTLQKIGMEKVKFSRSGGHIHIKFCKSTPSANLISNLLSPTEALVQVTEFVKFLQLFLKSMMIHNHFPL